MASVFKRVIDAIRSPSPAVERREEPALSIEEKASAAGTAIVATSVGNPVWMRRNIENFAEEGYMRNAIAFRCIQMIAQAGSFVPLLLQGKAAKEIDDHPLIDLLNRPAPNTTGVELFERLFTYLKIAGNAYVEGVGVTSRKAPPRELYSLRPDRMKIIAGRDAVPQAFEYEANGRKVDWQVDPITGECRVLHLKLFHPIDDWYGLSALEPAAFGVDRHNEAGAHNMAVLQNGAVPSGALAFKPVVIDGSAQSAPGEIIQAAEKKLEERHQGARNSGRPFVFGGNVEWLTFGQSMEQLQLTESKLDAARDICIAMGVPHILLVPGQSTYNNNREAKLALYEETVLPLLQWIVDHFNVWLTPQFGDGLKLIIDFDAIDALSLRREEKRKTYVELYDKRLVSRAEVREGLAYEPWEGMPDVDARPEEIAAVTGLMNSNKLSRETGWGILQRWGILDKDFNAKDEQERLDTQSEDAMNGLTGLNGIEEEPAVGEDGKPVAPGTPKPKPNVVVPPVAAPKVVN